MDSQRKADLDAASVREAGARRQQVYRDRVRAAAAEALRNEATVVEGARTAALPAPAPSASSSSSSGSARSTRSRPMPLDPSNMMTRSATSMSLEGPSSLIAIDLEELHRRREVLTASDAQARAVHNIAAATERYSASSGHPFDDDLSAPAAAI